MARRPITDKELDALCRRLVFERDGHACVKTGKTDRLQWAHVYSRNKKSMRWDPDNSMCLSAGAHLWWHHKPTEAVEWFAATYPERHARLKLRAQTPQKLDRAATLLWLERALEGGS